jgi:hypothetical protein
MSGLQSPHRAGWLLALVSNCDLATVVGERFAQKPSNILRQFGVVG